MEKKVSDNINNKNAVPNKNIHNGYDCKHSKSFSLERISKFVNNMIHRIMFTFVILRMFLILFKVQSVMSFKN